MGRGKLIDIEPFINTARLEGDRHQLKVLNELKKAIIDKQKEKKRLTKYTESKENEIFRILLKRRIENKDSRYKTPELDIEILKKVMLSKYPKKDYPTFVRIIFKSLNLELE